MNRIDALRWASVARQRAVVARNAERIWHETARFGNIVSSRGFKLRWNETANSFTKCYLSETYAARVAAWASQQLENYSTPDFPTAWLEGVGKRAVEKRAAFAARANDDFETAGLESN